MMDHAFRGDVWWMRMLQVMRGSVFLPAGAGGLLCSLLRGRMDLRIQAVLLSDRLYQDPIMQTLDVVAACVNGLYIGFTLLPYHMSCLLYTSTGVRGIGAEKSAPLPYPIPHP